MKLIRVAIGAVLLAPVSLVVGRVDAQTPSKVDSFAECISREHVLDVLFLVDESKSLRELKEGGRVKVGNDPKDDRVAALKSVVSVLESSLSATRNSTESTSDSELKVNIAVSGFGDQYRQRMGFESLSSDSVAEIDAVLDKQAEHDSDLHTRYHVALDGSLKSFKDHAQTQSCRLLMWFSDGQHDDDNSAGFNKQERNQIQTQVCGSSGLVDQLRTEGVYIVAAGLNKDPKQLGLMKMIAAGGEPYVSNGLAKEEGAPSVSVRKCGETEPFGTFEIASDAEKIVDSIFKALRSVPGVPNQGVMIGDVPKDVCTPDKGQVCQGFWFRADETIKSFNMLLSRPKADVVVDVVMPGGSRRIVMGDEVAAPPLPSDIVSITSVTRNKALVSAHNSESNTIKGDWYVSFRGPDVTGSTGYVSFVGSADVKVIKPAPVKSVLEVNRNGATDIVLKVASSDKVSSVQNVDAVFANGEKEVPAQVIRGVDDNFVIQKAEVERILKSADLADASGVTLRLQPVGKIDGLKILDDTAVSGVNDAVSAEYKSTEKDLAVRNGASFPVCFNYAGQEVRFKGRPQVDLELRCQGPDSGKGTVSFAGVGENPGDFEIVNPQPCVLDVHEEGVCPLTLKPNTNTFQRADLGVELTYSDVAGKEEKATVQIPIVTEKPTNVGSGVWAAVELISIFLLIQGLVRLGLSFLLSRFAPLSPTAERVRLDASVSSDGMVQLNPKQITPSASDKGFATENDSSKRDFSVFGYEFRCSPLRTFLRSTTRPVGYVEKGGYAVFGPQGTKTPKKAPFPAVGMVDLALSGQWVVGIPERAIEQLANGEASVDAEVVAFIAPTSQTSLETQEVNLGMEMAASRVMNDITALIESVRAIRDAGGDFELVDNIESAGGGIGTPSIDPFGDFVLDSGSVQETSDTSVRKKSDKRRGRRSESETFPEMQTPEPPSMDRFS